MIQKRFEDIGRSDIESLVETKVPESRMLEFKSTLPPMDRPNKLEFLADVSSFANASGGDLIYGMEAERNEEGQKTGAASGIVPMSRETSDELQLKLENLIRSSITPRLRVHIKAIKGWPDDEESYVLVIRVDQSIAAPHMVRLDKSSRFYSRTSAGKYLLDVQELRTAFLASESQADRIKQFRQNRLGLVVADETPVNLLSPARLVMHVVPLVSFLNTSRLDFGVQIYEVRSLAPIGRGGWNSRFNLDGFLNFSNCNVHSHTSYGYCQLFRDGTIEAVDSDIIRQDRDGGHFVAPYAIENSVTKALGSYFKFYKAYEVRPPIAISLALLNCKGSLIEYMDRVFVDEYHPIDRNTVMLPDLVVDDLDVDIRRVMKPAFDAIWNAGGFPRSLSYDDGGTWNR